MEGGEEVGMEMGGYDEGSCDAMELVTVVFR